MLTTLGTNWLFLTLLKQSPTLFQLKWDRGTVRGILLAVDDLLQPKLPTAQTQISIELCYAK